MDGSMQEKAAAFAREHGMGLDPATRFLDFSSEAGELAKELLKASEYGKRPMAVTDGMTEELGDCLFSLLCLAEGLGVDAASALDLVLEKYRRRHEERGEIGSGR